MVRTRSRLNGSMAQARCLCLMVEELLRWMMMVEGCRLVVAWLAIIIGGDGGKDFEKAGAMTGSGPINQSPQSHILLLFD